MFFQKGLGAQIQNLLESSDFNIDITKQDRVNTYLARLGSIDGRYGTIDLSSASDTISAKFVKYIMPRIAYASLDMVRTKTTKCILRGRPVIIPLELFSSMGNGFTFPLQTLIFACIVKAVYLSMGLPVNNKDYPHYSVFGDDIVVVRTAYDRVVGLLEYCGFSVNALKSYNTGCFRESCGKDYFHGTNIRGIYIRSLNDEPQIYSAFNRLVRWSAITGIRITGILSYLRGLAKFRPVPFDEGDDAGFKIPSTYVCQPEVAGLRRYRCLEPVADIRSLGGYVQNYHACVIAMLGGYVRGNRYAVRGKMTEAHEDPDSDRVVSYRLSRQLVTSSWDWLPYKGLTILDYERVWAPLV